MLFAYHVIFIEGRLLKLLKAQLDNFYCIIHDCLEPRPSLKRKKLSTYTLEQEPVYKMVHYKRDL